jgi:ketosteroid isomerase-like protein
MSQENVEVVRRAFQAFPDQDLDGALADFTEDVEWRLIGGFADLMGSEFRSPEEVRSFMLQLGENLGWAPPRRASARRASGSW